MATPHPISITSEIERQADIGLLSHHFRSPTALPIGAYRRRMLEKPLVFKRGHSSEQIRRSWCLTKKDNSARPELWLLRRSISRRLFLWATLNLLGASAFGSQLSGQSTVDWEKSAGGKMAFEVGSVKQEDPSTPAGPSRSAFPLNNQEGFYPNGGLFSATNYRLEALIAFAYKLTPLQTQALASQLPKWAATERFDVQARASANAAKDQIRLMMQSLLADRFKLVTHIETRQGPVMAFVLVKPGKTGPQLVSHSNSDPCIDLPPPAEPGAPPAAPQIVGNGFPAVCGTVRVALGHRGYRASARNVTLSQFAGYLPGPPMNSIDRPVTDKTGLAGTFDIILEWKPDLPISLNGSVVPMDDDAETFLEALGDQLGVKLESTTGPFETLVIDHIEQLSPN